MCTVYRNLENTIFISISACKSFRCPLLKHTSARLGSTYTKIAIIQRLTWPLHKDDTQICEAFHIFIYFQGSNGETDIKNRLMVMERGEERVRCMKRVTWTLTLP